MLRREGHKVNKKRVQRIYREEKLTVIDNCARECLALVAEASLSGARVARELDASAKAIRSGSPVAGDLQTRRP